MLYLLIASIIWSFSFGLIKHVLVGVDPFFIALTRLALSCLLFLPFLRPAQITRRLTGWLLLIGGIQYGLMYILYLFSFRYLKAHEIALFTIFTPIYVSIILAISSRGKIAVIFLASLLAVLGAGVILSVSNQLRFAFAGFMLLQGANFCFALGQVMYRQIIKPYPKLKDSSIFALLYIGATLVAFFPALFRFTQGANLDLETNQVLALIYLGIIPSGICFFLWNMGARKARPGTLAVMNNAKIPLAVLCSLLFFGEKTSLVHFLIGTGILIVALFLGQKSGFRKT